MAQPDVSPTDEQIEAARLRGAERTSREPRASAIKFDATSHRFELLLVGGTAIGFSADRLSELAGAPSAALGQVEILGPGTGLTWPMLGMDVSVTGLVMDLTYGDGWRESFRREVFVEAARRKSESGRAAARENGRKGGRPRKASAAEA